MILHVTVRLFPWLRLLLPPILIEIPSLSLGGKKSNGQHRKKPCQKNGSFTTSSPGWWVAVLVSTNFLVYTYICMRLLFTYNDDEAAFSTAFSLWVPYIARYRYCIYTRTQTLTRKERAYYDDTPVLEEQKF